MGFVYALAGNPNCGKTTLFNELTGSRQHVGNWPGVTVDKKVGYIKPRRAGIGVVDLPGLYSLSPNSGDELAARNFLIEGKPDLIINIVDATHLERNLFLTLQLAELGRPMIIALNMTDRLRSMGMEIDIKQLEQRLSVAIVPISASQGQGIDTLLKTAYKAAQAANASGCINEYYPSPLLVAIKRIEDVAAVYCTKAGIPKRWAAVRLMDGDPQMIQQLKLTPEDKHRIEKIADSTAARYGERDIIIADRKYRFISRICAGCIKRNAQPQSISNRIDRVVTHRLLALPLFFSVMTAVFYFTFGPPGAFLSECMIKAIEQLAPMVGAGLKGIHAQDWMVSLVCDGILNGIGSVAGFLPQLMLLFFFLSVLEDSGYMARAAFLVDRLLRPTGLSGKSFVPMLMGFGCTVSGVMAARTLSTQRDRRMTILLTPFLSCSAKMPVYALVTAAFFPSGQAAFVVICLYAAGVSAALISALILRKTAFKGEQAPFLMELPPYRLPTFKTLWVSISERIWDFVVRAGTVLLMASVVIWFLREFDPSLHRLATGSNENSILAAAGRFISPVLAPLGLGFWQAAVALVTGLLAKEAIVGTLTILYSTSAGISVSAALQTAFTPASALSFLVFVLFYAPCIAAFSAMRRELHSLKWAVGWGVMQTCIAWAASFIVYHLGTLFMHLVKLIP